MNGKLFSFLLLISFSTFLFSVNTIVYNRKEFSYYHSKNRKMFIQFYDPYSDQTFYNPQDMEVDHIVPIKVAWDLGAKHWDNSTKRKFANDFENLILVSKSCNRSKGSKPLSEWLPFNQNFHSEYSNRYLLIIDKYNLKGQPSSLL